MICQIAILNNAYIMLNNLLDYLFIVLLIRQSQKNLLPLQPEMGILYLFL